MPSRLLLINGSVRGANGNTAKLLETAKHLLPPDWLARALCLADYAGSIEELAQELTDADAFLLGTGVYWGSWGSPLQRFLEVMSGYELDACFLGKPVAALISADSVGGLDLAQRLLGAFSLLGCLVPPLSTLVLSRAALAACRREPDANRDVWQVDDLAVVIQNLIVAQSVRALPWATWPVRQLPRLTGPYPSHGELSVGLEELE